MHVKEWKDIYREYLAIKDSLVDWHEKELYLEGWKVFGLYNFPYGEPIEENIKRCPVTAEFVKNNFPQHGAAGFSMLMPKTHIARHVGFQGPFLRYHLGLKVPEGDCALDTSEGLMKWKEGEAFVFDDRQEHEAWNNTDEDRVILLIDFIPQWTKKQ